MRVRTPSSASRSMFDCRASSWRPFGVKVAIGAGVPASIHRRAVRWAPLICGIGGDERSDTGSPPRREADEMRRAVFPSRATSSRPRLCGSRAFQTRETRVRPVAEGIALDFLGRRHLEIERQGQPLSVMSARCRRREEYPAGLPRRCAVISPSPLFLAELPARTRVRERRAAALAPRSPRGRC